MIKTNNNITSVTATITTTPKIKLEMDRRISTTSESSVEPMDLGRTPTPKKKFQTKDINNDTIINNTILNNIKLTNNIDSEENSYDSDEHENEYLQQQHKNNITTNIKLSNKKLHRQRNNNNNNNHHHHREKRIIQIEENDNPHSLRKKFRISTPNRNNNNLINHKNNNNNLILTKINNNNDEEEQQQEHKFDNNQQHTIIKNDINNDDCCIGSGDDEDRTNNESGFVDTSGHNINSSPTSTTSSSPESGIGERGDDVKYVCPICEIVSATPHEFTNHIRCHNYSSGDSENFTCRICSKVLSSASSLDRHVLVHTGERPFNCKYCHLTFTTNGNMHRHMRTHKQHQQQHHQRNNSNNNNNNSSTIVTTNGNDSSSGGGGGGVGIQNKTSNNNGKPIKDNKNNNNNKMNISNNNNNNNNTNNTNNNNISGGSGNNSSSNGGESYESDGCSTDSSISADHVSNNIIIKTTKNCNNINNNNNNNNIIINNNYNKRKSTDDFDNNGENILNGIIKRRIKTTINNNNIINENDININTINNDNNILSKLCCPVCNRYDFINMLTLGTHMDREHSDIPAKCRECDVVFKTHKQLNGHRCCNNNNINNNDKLNITHGFRDLTFVDFSSEKFPLIAKSLCEQTLRTSISNQKYECPKCFRAFPCNSAVDIHVKECYHDGNDEILTSSIIPTTNKLIASLPTILPHDFSMRKKNITTSKRKQSDEDSESSIDDDNNNNHNNNDDVNNVNRNRDEFFAHLDLQNKSTSSLMSSPSRTEKSDHNKSDLDKTPTKITAATTGTTSNHHLNINNNNNSYHNHHQNNHQSPSFSLLQQQQVLQQQQNDSKDLADIQSILNVTSSSNNFLRNFENNVNTPSSECGYGKDEEEAQDAFTSEFRKMKLRGEFPCKLCTAVFPNLRALKGHNRIHISAAGAAGPFRCNMCPYSIHDKAALVRHMRSHNGDRPYECAVCNYAFTTKANCERHLRNRHAKTTREEVKRAIIYHPSEDSSCDDPTKKLHLFSSPEFDNDDVVEINPTPKDRSTPVSHLKEILQNDNKPMKIQVKSLEKLLDKSSISSYNHYDDREEKELDNESQSDTSHPIDLSMDALDLSKKSTKITEDKLENDNVQEQPKIDMDLLQKNHQILLAQQQFLSENLPKIDSAQYFQFSQLCNNLVFPQLHPAFFLQNTFLPNNLADFNKFAPLLTTGIFGNPPAFNIPPTLNANIQNQQLLQPPQEPQSPSKIFENPIQKLTTPSPAQLLPKSLTPTSNQLNITQHLSPTEQSTQPQQQQQQQPQTKQMAPQPIHNNNNNGPVKMVIKNGVLMPKQKQRRYRTERPFACEHCSARFTLRSNMERHIKQQHPQQWAQRQRTGQHVIRGRGNSSNVISQISSSHLRNSSIPVNNNNNNMSSSNHFSAISDQVKYAILAQQLKARKDTDILQQALSQGSNVNAFNNTLNNNSTSVEDDDPKLIIDEDDEEDEEEDDDDDGEDVICEEPKPQDLSNTTEVTANKIAAKKVAETILEQAIKAGNNLSKKCLNNEDRNNATKDFELKIANTMIARAESVGKYLKEVASSPFKDDQPDLVSVSKLVDNATIPLSFNNYFRPSDIANQMEQSDEEGLVASGSASDNNSGPEETLTNTNPDQKKKSAYSLAPNRVSCPYCQRMFPWSSSLRRHILTHTGQKPFKCSHCPLLFTTKSNCDRHLLRKHGNVESAVSLYVPIEDIPDPIPTPKAVAEAKAAAAAMLTTNEENELPKINSINIPLSVTANQNIQKNVIEPPIITSADLPYKCHLCDSSFSERLQCLDHIKISHVQEFALLLAKGAIDTEAEHNNQILQSNEDDERRADDGRGKYPDYANRKVICAFCVRRFWSTEDLRRHMRTHSGERPFQCEICLRKFTLKHSMLRHMKKHNGNHHNNMQTSTNSGSDISDDEQTPTNRQTNNITSSSNINNNNNMILSNSLRNHKIHDILSKANLSWRNQMARFGFIGEHQKENIAFQQQQHHQTVIKTEQNDDNLGTSNNGITTTSNSDLIGNLLGISDQGILNKLLSSADEAAKFLGIDK